MRALLLRWILMTIAVWAAGKILPHTMIELQTVWAAVLAAAVIGLLNALVKPFLFLFRLVTLPVNLLTLGVFGLIVSFVANMIVFWVVGLGWMQGFQVHGVAGAAAGAAITGVINGILIMLIPEARGRRR